MCCHPLMPPTDPLPRTLAPQPACMSFSTVLRYGSGTLGPGGAGWAPSRRSGEGRNPGRGRGGAGFSLSSFRRRPEPRGRAGRRGALPLVVPAKAGTQGPGRAARGSPSRRSGEGRNPGRGRGGAGSLSLIPSPPLCALHALRGCSLRPPPARPPDAPPTHRRRGRPLHFTPPSATLSQCRRPQPNSQPPSSNTSPTSAPSGRPAAPPASAPTTLPSATCSTPSEPPSGPKSPASPSSPTTARATQTSASTPPNSCVAEGLPRDSFPSAAWSRSSPPATTPG